MFFSSTSFHRRIAQLHPTTFRLSEAVLQFFAQHGFTHQHTLKYLLWEWGSA